MKQKREGLTNKGGILIDNNQETGTNVVIPS
jgi:hypothetical protein